MAKLTIQFKEIKEAADKLEPSKLYWPQAKDMLRTIGFLGVQSLKGGAPKGRSGQTGARIQYRVNDIPKPLWVVFRTDATNTPQKPGGRGGFGARGAKKKWEYPFAYPRRLEYEKKNPHYQWMHRGIQQARGKFRSAISRAAADIQANWAST